jgi:hypothetical protein
LFTPFGINLPSLSWVGIRKERVIRESASISDHYGEMEGRHAVRTMQAFHIVRSQAPGHFADPPANLAHGKANGTYHAHTRNRVALARYREIYQVKYIGRYCFEPHGWFVLELMSRTYAPTLSFENMQILGLNNMYTSNQELGVHISAYVRCTIVRRAYVRNERRIAYRQFEQAFATLIS